MPLNRNGWHASDGGNGTGNRKTIAIEICYSKSGGSRFEKAQKNAAELCAKLLKDYGWTTDDIYTHEHFAPNKKHCPHRTLDDYGWSYFINLVKSFSTAEEETYRIRKTWADAKSQIGAYKSLDNAKKACKESYSVFDSKGNCVYTKAASKIDVTYQVFANGKFLPNVKNLEDYAGIFNKPISAVYANLSSGNITYKVHTLNGKWLPEVVNRKDFAGIKNKSIDGLMMKTDTGKTIKYRVHTVKGKWLPYVTGYSEKDSNNGYAGIMGTAIDGIQVVIE